jgi:tetratricopeptide (TPR) repeat protein
MIWALCGGPRAVRFVLLLFFVLAFAGCTSVDQRFKRASEAELRGDVVAALADYQELILRLPLTDRSRLALAYVKAGECYWRLQHPSEALKSFEQGAALDATNVLAHLRMAELLTPQAPDRALAEARTALHFDPKNAEAFSVMGAAYTVSGQMPLARISYQRALELDPDRVSVAIALADLQYRELNVGDARATLRRAAATVPHNALPWLALGRLEEQEGDSDAAEEAYRNALAAENTPETNLRLAQFLQRNARITEAEKILKRADALQPWLPTALPDFELQSGRVLNAVQAYTSALRPGGLPAAPGAARAQRGLLAARVVEADLSLEVPEASQVARRHLEQYRADLDPVTSLVLQAEILMHEGDLASARTAAASAVAQADESAAAHYVLGVVQQRSGDLARARAEWSRAVTLDPGLVPARLAIAAEELRDGDPAAAEEHVALVLRDEPANLRALCLFARVLLRQKRYEPAVSIARRAIAADGGDAEPRLLQGEIALARGNPGEALLAYEQAVLLEPRSREALDGLVRVYRSGRVTRPMILHMERVAAQPPRSAALMEIAGRLYRDRGFHADAERAFRAALELDRERSAAAAELARTYAATGALREAERSLARSGGDAALLLGAFDAEQRNDTATAIRQYETAVRRGERTGVAANNLAWLYARERTNLDRALALAEQALMLAPSDPRVLDTVGFVRLQRREYTEAVAALKRAFDLARAPRSRRAPDAQLVAELRSHLAEAYRRAGQPHDADALALD